MYHKKVIYSAMTLNTCINYTNPFENNKCAGLPLKAQEDLADISMYSFLQEEFKTTNLLVYQNGWLSNSCTIGSEHSFTICFHLPVRIRVFNHDISQIKYSNAIDDLETVMRPPLTTIEPRYDLLMRNMRFHTFY